MADELTGGGCATAHVATGLPAGPGYTLKLLVSNYAKAKNSQMTAAAFRDSVFFYSECTWVNYRVTNSTTGRTAAKQQGRPGLGRHRCQARQPSPDRRG